MWPSTTISRRDSHTSLSAMCHLQEVGPTSRPYFRKASQSGVPNDFAGEIMWEESSCEQRFAFQADCCPCHPPPPFNFNGRAVRDNLVIFVVLVRCTSAGNIECYGLWAGGQIVAQHVILASPFCEHRVGKTWLRNNFLLVKHKLEVPTSKNAWSRVMQSHEQILVSNQGKHGVCINSGDRQTRKLSELRTSPVEENQTFEAPTKKQTYNIQW